MIQNTNLSNLLNETITLLEPQITSKNISVNLNIQNKLYINIDRVILSTVFRNLISNAIKYSKIGGVIDIKINNNKDFLEFTIEDNGVGMSQETAQKLFSNNKYKSTVGTDGESGTGIGLNLGKELIELHGGKIWVDSILGSGTSFHFTIPLNK